jgi:hypothetical protein
MRLIVFLCALLLCAFTPPEKEFDQLMGKGSKRWQLISQEEDRTDLERFRALYAENRQRLELPAAEVKIPHVVHFIWLGPRPFPPQSVENVRTWLARNPGWKVKFWTDRKRPPPCEGMEVCQVQDFYFSRLGRCYEESENWGEKSDLLRYEILYQEGGVYADHDANCLRPFADLHAGYDLYCCLETPHPPFVGRSITAGNGVIGSRAHHPVLAAVINRIALRWDELGRQFRGRDGYARTEVVMQRTYIALTHALREALGQEGNVDIVLPSSYFFAKEGLPSLYSKHFFAAAWTEQGDKPSPFEKKNQRLLRKAVSRGSLLTKGIAAALGLNALFVVLACRRRRAH